MLSILNQNQTKCIAKHTDKKSQQQPDWGWKENFDEKIEPHINYDLNDIFLKMIDCTEKQMKFILNLTNGIKTLQNNPKKWKLIEWMNLIHI